MEQNNIHTATGEGMTNAGTRLFVVYNRAYNPKYVMTDSQDRALELAVKIGHIRRAISIRRFSDVTEEALQDAAHGESLRKLIEAETHGCVELGDEGWQTCK